MRKLFLSEFITLDGVIQAPGGSDEDMEDGFQHGGWQAELFDDAMGTAVTEYMAETGGFVLGRKTYQFFAGYWPALLLLPLRSLRGLARHPVPPRPLIHRLIASHSLTREKPGTAPTPTSQNNNDIPTD
jgi:dihydrofolate reductase